MSKDNDAPPAYFPQQDNRGFQMPSSYFSGLKRPSPPASSMDGSPLDPKTGGGNGGQGSGKTSLFYKAPMMTQPMTDEELMMKALPPEGGVSDEMLAELFGMNGEAARVAAFGPDYFRGAMWGAGTTGVFSTWQARRYYKEVQLVRWADPKNPRSLNTLLSIQPISIVGLTAFSLISVLKTAKFFASRARYNEFLWEEYWESELANDGDLAALETLAVEREKAKEKEEFVGSDNKALKEWSKQNKILPSFWDGFMVGVLGSLQDSWFPTKPVDRYTDKSGGKRW